MLGTVIGAGLQLASGYMASKSQDKANKYARQQAQQNRADQKEFAQNQLQWKAADAKAAGIHPIFAMGNSPISFSPINTGISGSNPMAQAMSGMGQDLSRASMAKQTPHGRNATMNAALSKLGLERASLQNDLLRTQIKATTMRINRSQLPPSMPSPVEVMPQQIIKGRTSTPHIDPGQVTDVGHARTKTGYAPIPSEQVKERIEDNIPAELMHFYRNQIKPNFNQNFSPPFKAPKGKRWIFAPLAQEYQLVTKNSWQDRIFGPAWGN